MNKGFVVWFTGLSGSGKTTVARLLAEKLRLAGVERIELLDGDEVRKWLSPEAGFTREDRERHLRRVAHVSRLLARNGVAVLCSFVSPYRGIREEVRRIVESDGVPFVEVYVKCSIETCIKRDPKGLYKRALRGEIKHMTGIDDPYEPPENPDVTVDTESESPEECAKRVFEALAERGLVSTR